MLLLPVHRMMYVAAYGLMCEVVLSCCRHPGTSGAQSAMVWKHKGYWAEGSSDFPGGDGQSDEGPLQG